MLPTSSFSQQLLSVIGNHAGLFSCGGGGRLIVLPSSGLVFPYLEVQSTIDNPNLQRKLKKVPVIWSWEQMTGNIKEKNAVHCISTKQQEKFRYCELCRLQREQRRATATMHCS